MLAYACIQVGKVVDSLYLRAGKLS